MSYDQLETQFNKKNALLRFTADDVVKMDFEKQKCATIDLLNIVETLYSYDAKDINYPKSMSVKTKQNYHINKYDEITKRLLDYPRKPTKDKYNNFIKWINDALPLRKKQYGTLFNPTKNTITDEASNLLIKDEIYPIIKCIYGRDLAKEFKEETKSIEDKLDAMLAEGNKISDEIIKIQVEKYYKNI